MLELIKAYCEWENPNRGHLVTDMHRSNGSLCHSVCSCVSVFMN